DLARAVGVESVLAVLLQTVAADKIVVAYHHSGAGVVPDRVGLDRPAAGRVVVHHALVVGGPGRAEVLDGQIPDHDPGGVAGECVPIAVAPIKYRAWRADVGVAMLGDYLIEGRGAESVRTGGQPESGPGRI